MAINFPLRTAFAVPQVLIGGIFIFTNFQELFDFLSYFFYHPSDHWVMCYSAPIICIFSAVVFVVEF
jgi:hypothetical protein